MQTVSLSAAKDRAYPGPGVGRESSAGYWITQSKRSQHRADGAVIGEPLPRECGYGGIFKNIESAFTGVDDVSLHADAEIAVEEILDVAPAAPSVIIADVAVVFPKPSGSLNRALDNILQPESACVIGVSKQIGAPKADVPFIIFVELGAG